MNHLHARQLLGQRVGAFDLAGVRADLNDRLVGVRRRLLGVEQFRFVEQLQRQLVRGNLLGAATEVLMA